MDDDRGARAATGRHGATPSGGSRRQNPWLTLLPVVTFLAGVVLTVFVLGTAGAGDQTPGLADPEPSAPPPPLVAEPAPEPTDPGLEVRVPASCVEAAEFTETVTSALSDIAGAARDLDARRLQETLDVVERLAPDVEAAASECRELAATGEVVVAPTPTPAPAPEPEPTTEFPTPTPTGPAPVEPAPGASEPSPDA